MRMDECEKEVSRLRFVLSRFVDAFAEWIMVKGKEQEREAALMLWRAFGRARQELEDKRVDPLIYLVAVDYDNTLLRHSTNNIDVARVNALFDDPFNYIVVYTARPWSHLPSIRARLQSAGVYYHAIVCGKMRASVYVDDRNVGGLRWPEESEDRPHLIQLRLW